MDEQGVKYKPVTGKTYSLYGKSSGTEQYYSLIRKLVDLFLQKYPDEKKLLSQIQKAGRGSIFRKLYGKNIDRSLILFVRKTVKDSLSAYTKPVCSHISNLPLSQKFDSIIATTEEHYHLYMIEIELINRIYKEAFKKCEYKFALIGHCLRDFRQDCRSVEGDIESVCKGCTKDCFINLGSHLLKKYNVHPYISLTMDLKELFEELKDKHQSIGALGIACIPELVSGMRLCIKLGIPPVGIPLDANRCERWMGKAHESSFNLKELEELLK
ncbi:MAG: DUF116 domain-containing protein [Nitrospirota bacterium]